MTSVKYLFAAIILGSTAYAIDNIPWPITPTDSTHTLQHSYGDFHRPWNSIEPVNFHFGIDIQDPTPSIFDDAAEDVFCVRHGFVSDVSWKPDAPPPDTTTNNLHDDYVVVVCDNIGQQSGYGWCYQYIEDYTVPDTLNPWGVSNEIQFGARLGDIENGVYTEDYRNHLLQSLKQHSTKVQHSYRIDICLPPPLHICSQLQ